VKRSKWLLRRTDQLVDLLHTSDMKTKIPGIADVFTWLNPLTINI
jgi:hypothetical protein